MDTYDFYGVTIHYRLENRKSGTSLIMSFRPNGNIVYEMTPRDITRDLNAGTSIEGIIEKHAPTFVKRLFTEDASKAPLPPERQWQTYSLSLAVMWTLSKDILCRIGNWEAATVKDYDNTFKRLIKDWGNYPMRDVTPNLCASKFAKLSPDQHRRAAIALRQLWSYVGPQIGIIDNPWSGYSEQGQKTKNSHKKLLQANIARGNLSISQCQKIVDRCFSGLTNKIEGGYYFVTLLLLTLALSLNEVCALCFADFSFLDYYADCQVVRISHSVVKAAKNYKLQRIMSPYKVRTLPLPALVQSAFEFYLSSVKAQGNFDASLPIASAARNIQRRTNPQHLASWIAEHFADILSDCNASFPVTSNKKAHTYLIDTAKHAMHRCGCDDEEYRFLVGLAPQATHAKHYCDFSSEAELNKLCSLLNRQTRLYALSHRTPSHSISEDFLKRKGERLDWVPKDFQRTDVDISIHLPPLDPNKVPQEGLRFYLSAHFGSRYTITYTENK